MPRTVNMISPNTGGVVEVPEGELSYAIRRGYKQQTDADVTAGLDAAVDAGHTSSYQSIGGKVDAFDDSALGAATFGASDVVRKVVGDDMDYSRQVREANPKTAMAGSVVGSVLPAMAGIGPGGALSNVASGIAESGAARGAIGKVIGAAAGGAIEGGAQSAGQYVSDVALGNKKLSAEAFLAETGHGALWGGAIGGGFGAAEAGFTNAKRLFPKSQVTKQAVQEAEQAATSATTTARRAGDEAEVVANRRLVEIRANNPAAEEAAQRAEVDWKARAEQAKASQAISRADEQAAKAKLAEHKVTVAERKEAERLAKQTKKPPTAPGEAAAPVAPGAAEPVPAVTDAPVGTTETAPQGAAVGEQAGATGSASSSTAKPAQTLDEAIEDAVAAADPEAAAIVKAKRDYTFARSKLPRVEGENASGRDWKVRGHQGEGTDALNDQQLAETTLGRVQEALGKKGVTATQRKAVEDLLTPKRLEALKALERGEVQHMPYWFNKEHIFEGRTFKISDLVNSDDVVEARRMVHGVRSDLEPAKYDPLYNYKKTGKLQDFSEAKPRVDQHGDIWDAETLHNIGVLGDYERSMHGLTTALGQAAPASAVAHATEYAAAAQHATDATATSMARNAEHVEAATAGSEARAAVGPDGGAPVAPERAVASSVADTQSKAAYDAAEKNLRDLSGVKSNVGAAPKAAGTSKSLGHIADAGAALEMLHTLGVGGLPDIHDIPVIGPLLSLYLKARAASKVFKRLGGKIPETGEAIVAARAAAHQDKIRAALGTFLDAGAKVSAVAARKAPGAAMAALAHVQFGRPGQRDDSKGTDAEMVARRVSELHDAIADEGSTQQRIREQVRVSDPELADAIAGSFIARAKFLASKAPLDPRAPSPFPRRAWTPSPADVQKFAKFLHYADNPGALFSEMAAGHVSMDGVETVKACYPELYDHAQSQALHLLSESGGNIPYERRVSMSLVFDVVGDPTLAPNSNAAMQADYAPAPPPAPINSPMPPHSGLSGDASGMVSMYATPFDQRAR